MTLTLETGSGIRSANAYVTAAFVTQYLTDHNRAAENSWDSASSAVKDAAVVAASQYIDTRWGDRFKGSRQFWFNGTNAQGLLTFSGQPTANDTITVGSETYTFKAALSTLGSYEVLIGATTSDTISNFIAAVNANSLADKGVIYSASMTGNQSCTAALLEDSTTEVLLTARQKGSSGNDIPLTESADNVTVDNVFTNGSDGGSQPMEFPRLGLSDKSGRTVQGIPLRVKQATAEYAVRVLAGTLYQDPTVDAKGQAVKKEKIGPIETEYQDSTALTQLMKPYPAADRLLRPYLRPAGVTR